MRVVAPYTAFHPLTEAWLREYAPPVEYVHLEHDSAYWDLLCSLWASGDDFALIEHDMVPHDTTLPGFLDCPNGWCLHPYEGAPILGTPRRRIFRCALGCTRFRGEFTARYPDTVSRLRHTSTTIFGRYCNTTWDRMDSQIASILFQSGERPCEHEPMVDHHHPVCECGTDAGWTPSGLCITCNGYTL